MISKTGMKLTLGAMLLSLCAASYAEESASAVDYALRIQKGDNLSKLAQEVVDEKVGWSKVAAYNKLSDAHMLRPGDTLNIPVAWLKNYPVAARIETLSGDVRLNGHPAKVGDAVSENDVLETAVGSGLRLRLPDGSTVNMLEESNVEAKEIVKKGRGNFFHTVFKLVSGRIDAIKNAFPAERSPLLIQGMHGTIGVRGTHFRMAQVGDDTLAEIEHGRVAFEGGKQSVSLSGGEGSVADGVQVPAVIPLLEAPTPLNVPENFDNILVRVDLQKLAGAQAYRGEVAHEEDFANILVQKTYSGEQIRIPGLADGTYWLRLRAIDTHGLQGLESRTKFVLKAHPVAPLLTESNDIKLMHGVTPPFAWLAVDEAQSYRFQISRDAEFKDVALKQDDIKEPRFSFGPGQHLQIGEFYWRVASVSQSGQGPWSEVRKLSVLPPHAPKPAPAFSKDRLVLSWQARPGQTFEYQLSGSKDFSAVKQTNKLATAKLDIAMPAAGQYFMRMRAVDADGYVGPWMPLQHFTVAD